MVTTLRHARINRNPVEQNIGTTVTQFITVRVILVTGCFTFNVSLAH